MEKRHCCPGKLYGPWANNVKSLQKDKQMDTTQKVIRKAHEL